MSMPVLEDSSIPHGQIKPNSSIGKWLTLAATVSDTIVETGTFCGLGSTYCLAMGLKRPEQQMWTFETEPKHHKIAEGLYSHYPNLHTINGKLQDHTNLLPDLIDLCLLDGGQLPQDTKAEVEAVIDKTKVIALDDSDRLKNIDHVPKFKERGWITMIEVKFPFPDRRFGFYAARNPAYEDPLADQ